MVTNQTGHLVHSLMRIGESRIQTRLLAVVRSRALWPSWQFLYLYCVIRIQKDRRQSGWPGTGSESEGGKRERERERGEGGREGGRETENRD
jgi:hypothetical protein